MNNKFQGTIYLVWVVHVFPTYGMGCTRVYYVWNSLYTSLNIKARGGHVCIIKRAEYSELHPN